MRHRIIMIGLCIDLRSGTQQTKKLKGRRDAVLYKCACEQYMPNFTEQINNIGAARVQ